MTKVKPHTGDSYNDEADRVAKEATFFGRPVFVHYNLHLSRTRYQVKNARHEILGIISFS